MLLDKADMEEAPQPKPWRLALVLTVTYVLAVSASLVPAIMVGNLAWLWPAVLALPWSLALVPLQMAFHGSFPADIAVILLCVLNSVLIWKVTRSIAAYAAEYKARMAKRELQEDTTPNE